MGFFYYIRSVALIEDLNIPEEHKFTDPQDFYSYADKMYSLVRINNDLYNNRLTDFILYKIYNDCQFVYEAVSRVTSFIVLSFKNGRGFFSMLDCTLYHKFR